MTQPSVGIVGNLGPLSTARLYKYIIEVYQTEVAAVRNADFPRIHVHSPLAIENVRLDRPDPATLDKLVASVRFLNAAGSDIIAIPCNTAHLYLDELREVSRAPILDMIAATVDQCVSCCEKEVSLIATRLTTLGGCYQRAFANTGVSVSLPSESAQAEIDDLIDTICAGVETRSIGSALIAIGLPAGTSVIFGCTELAELATNTMDGTCTVPNFRVYNSLWELARTVFRTLTTK